MTDLPRRSYPLVVAPPGGFEDAVRRGRKVRRRRTGGTSGVALLLVGALGYSVLGGTNGVSRIDPQDHREERKHERSAPVPVVPIVPTTSPQPGATTKPNPVAVGSPTPGSYVGVRPTTGPSSRVVATRGPVTTNDRRYAARPRITRDEAQTNTETQCYTAPVDQEWCAFAYVNDANAIDDEYVLEYNLCRSVNAPTVKLWFDWRQEVELAAIDNKNADTVWTYSLGVPRVREPKEVEFPSGTCVRWHMVWDGLDDYGLNPPKGEYTLVARPLARVAVEDSEAQYTFSHE